MMLVQSNNRSRARAIRYVYLLTSGLNVCRCKSLILADHPSQPPRRYSTKSTTSLYNSKLLDEKNHINVGSNQWSFVLCNNAEHHDKSKHAIIRNILVCGDGDLSYSAEIAPELDMLGIQLYATVLEDEATHNKGM
jgi:hypothetical protein